MVFSMVTLPRGASICEERSKGKAQIGSQTVVQVSTEMGT
jgi:hypothetical protein